MSLDRKLAMLAVDVACKRRFLHAAMNSGLFESFEGSRLSVGQPRFGAAFGESPASAAGLDQQEFDATASDPIANRGHLFASLESAKLRQSKELGGWLIRPGL
jgi:hypothetical protein